MRSRGEYIVTYRSAPKSGTTHFHAYGTAAVVHKGHRYTLALTYGEAMKDVVQRLLATVRRRGVKIKFLLLDKGFFSVETIMYLKHAGHEWHCRLWRLSLRRGAGDVSAGRFVHREVDEGKPAAVEQVARPDSHWSIAICSPGAQW